VGSDLVVGNTSGLIGTRSPKALKQLPAHEYASLITSCDTYMEETKTFDGLRDGGSGRKHDQIAETLK
jgi:hypothetical protein